MTYTFRKWQIPDRMMPGINRYIEDHIRPGDFLSAVITNNLKDAVQFADDENLANLPAFISYFYNEAPGLCWGSPEKMKRWLETKPPKLETVK